MPGLLPMKVIKVGSTAQSRVAQACDRCRSKKIRCDGVTPCCSQCANVGFECKTSDKLSRRAFPRGYTESLEERVRSLESENRELKDLLDSKDDKIDILSRIHSYSPSEKPLTSTSSNATSSTSRTSSIDPQSLKEECQSSQASATSDDQAISVTCSASASNGKPLIDALKSRLKENSPNSPAFKTQPFFASKGREAMPGMTSASPVPSRMASDQLINIYIQEWAPLFPIIHRPRALKLYADFLAEPNSQQSDDEVAQLYLMFSIAAVSAKWNNHDPQIFEPRWQTALEKATKDVSVSALQCLLLAEVYCAAKGDYERLRKYKTMAAKLSRRLGLHQSQKRTSLGPLATETRKRLFWVLYSLDCLSASMLGQTRTLNDLDIGCELPEDIDDEDITEGASLPMASSDSPRISSAIGIIQGSRILANVLDCLYPSTATKHVSFHTIGALSERLETWYQNLAPNLRLGFLQDKPSTSVSGSRSPFLSLMYNYVRTLLHRPLVLSGNESQRSSSAVTLAQSSKCIIQILQLLNERRMSFSFPLNKNHMLTMAGFGLLFQISDLRRECKLVQDSRRQLTVVVSLLELEKAAEKVEFTKAILATMKPLSLSTQDSVLATAPSYKGIVDNTMPAPKSVSTKSRQRSQKSAKRPSIAAVSTSPQIKQEMGNLPPSAAPYRSTFPLDVNEMEAKPGLLSHRPHSFPIVSRNPMFSPTSLPNLDYLDFNKETTDLSFGLHDINQGRGMGPQQAGMGSMASPNIFSYISDDPSSAKSLDWSSDFWSMSDDTGWQSQAGALSLSEEELTSGEELSSCGASSHFPSATLTGTGNLTASDGFGATLGL